MDYRTEILAIRSDYQYGRISYEDAVARVTPLLDEMNEKGAVIAKQHGKKYKKLTFGYVFR